MRCGVQRASTRVAGNDSGTRVPVPGTTQNTMILFKNTTDVTSSREQFLLVGVSPRLDSLSQPCYIYSWD